MVCLAIVSNARRAAPSDRIHWLAPTTGGPVAAYNVCISLHGSDQKDRVDTADRMHTFSNLAPGAYWITVTAKNSHGESEPQREGISLAPPAKD